MDPLTNSFNFEFSKCFRLIMSYNFDDIPWATYDTAP